MEIYVKLPNIEVLDNSIIEHAVTEESLGTLAVNFFEIIHIKLILFARIDQFGLNIFI